MGEDRVSNAAFPVLVALPAYFMAEAVLGVYNYGIDTILVCYCMDKRSTRTMSTQFRSGVRQQEQGKEEEQEPDDEEDETMMRS